MKITVIVPAYNAAATLPRCLKAIFDQRSDDTEVLVVNDGSTDATPQIADQAGARVLRTQRKSGPAAARNLAADAASGEILFFVDADVVLSEGSILRVTDTFETNPELAAIYGSYDDAPAEENFLSQYKNLLHHYVHQTSSTKSGTFWAGCGAIRAQVFHQVGGFDANQFPYPSVEDIDLGIRLNQKNFEILLDKKLQGKHLKRWTIGSLLKADVLHRALPWSRLIAVRGALPNELNLQIPHRISGVLVTLLVLLAGISIFQHSIWTWLSIALCIVGLLILNRKVYLFFLRKTGPLFLIGAIFWHTFYYLYSTITFACCWIRYRVLGSKSLGNARIHARHSA
jgi:glycosyltransferase involved in cell wall biosynthesis